MSRTVDFNSPIDMSKIADTPMPGIVTSGAGSHLNDDFTPFDFGDKASSGAGSPLNQASSGAVSRKPKIQIRTSNLQIKSRPKGRPKKATADVDSASKLDVVTFKPKSQKKRQKFGGAESLSENDKTYIIQNARADSVQNIADHLGKRRSTVLRYMDTHGLLGEEDIRDGKVKKAIINELHNQAFWVMIEQSYSPEEIIYFEEEWYAFVVQLDDNVLASERMQLRTLIENQISIDRLSITEYSINNEILQIDEEIASLQDELENLEDSDDDEVIRLHNEIASLKGIQGSLQTSKVNTSKEKSDIQKAQKILIDQLDMSRAKRVEQYDISDRTWAKMLLEIRENPRLKKQMGAMAFVSFLAVERMRSKLTQPYTYADGEVHAPMLLPEGCVNIEFGELVEQLYVPNTEESRT